ncbi:hypothetical protein MVES1_001020 [Malassezia vespertilionis]|uniref:Uncharacterized protein n=1 Tax=Malassezia vespertilionis TaxID=2020962 RepID=A0A2N1JFD9_9BASI|nr:uncharacterized protein MVES1_001020 [Malassezia vespertilionis]PKI85250.1 hypothetical protein MVES_000960 [Malassezia vespertilionis]WFD05688.1 hypothetical protein MVES1_001020 [Malassezia vespertilionis]
MDFKQSVTTRPIGSGAKHLGLNFPWSEPSVLEGPMEGGKANFLSVDDPESDTDSEDDILSPPQAAPRAPRAAAQAQRVSPAVPARPVPAAQPRVPLANVHSRTKLHTEAPEITPVPAKPAAKDSVRMSPPVTSMSLGPGLSPPLSGALKATLAPKAKLVSQNGTTNNGMDSAKYHQFFADQASPLSRYEADMSSAGHGSKLETSPPLVSKDAVPPKRSDKPTLNQPNRDYSKPGHGHSAADAYNKRMMTEKQQSSALPTLDTSRATADAESARDPTVLSDAQKAEQNGLGIGGIFGKSGDKSIKNTASRFFKKVGRTKQPSAPPMPVEGIQNQPSKEFNLARTRETAGDALQSSRPSSPMQFSGFRDRLRSTYDARVRSFSQEKSDPSRGLKQDPMPVSAAYQAVYLNDEVLSSAGGIQDEDYIEEEDEDFYEEGEEREEEEASMRGPRSAPPTQGPTPVVGQPFVQQNLNSFAARDAVKTSPDPLSQAGTAPTEQVPVQNRPLPQSKPVPSLSQVEEPNIKTQKATLDEPRRSMQAPQTPLEQAENTIAKAKPAAHGLASEDARSPQARREPSAYYPNDERANASHKAPQSRISSWASMFKEPKDGAAQSKNLWQSLMKKLHIGQAEAAAPTKTAETLGTSLSPPLAQGAVNEKPPKVPTEKPAFSNQNRQSRTISALKNPLRKQPKPPAPKPRTINLSVPEASPVTNSSDATPATNTKASAPPQLPTPAALLGKDRPDTAAVTRPGEANTLDAAGAADADASSHLGGAAVPILGAATSPQEDYYNQWIKGENGEYGYEYGYGENYNYGYEYGYGYDNAQQGYDPASTEESNLLNLNFNQNDWSLNFDFDRPKQRSMGYSNANGKSLAQTLGEPSAVRTDHNQPGVPHELEPNSSTKLPTMQSTFSLGAELVDFL